MIDIKDIFIGKNPILNNQKKVEGGYVLIDGEVFFKISNVDSMRPFFMSVVSSSNHWLFMSSNGGISAGRKNPDFALFPYYTDDKIIDSSNHTGSKSIFLIEKDKSRYLWEPFGNDQNKIYNTTRNLYKNTFGNKIIFEEKNHDLCVDFAYEWSTSNQFGFVRKCRLINTSDQAVNIRILDGIQNILPHGVNEDLQNSTSNLVDAYKRCELETDTGIAIYSLSSIIVDKAEPSEALKANIVWSLGFPKCRRLLSSKQLNLFRYGKLPIEEYEIRSERGAYFLVDDISLKSQDQKKWSIVSNVNQSIGDIIKLKQDLKNQDILQNDVNRSIYADTEELISLVGASDGIQLSSDKVRNARHFSNTMFNIMRGGIFDNNYNIEKSDFLNYIEKANFKVFFKKADILEGLPKTFDLDFLKKIASGDQDKNFKRLCFEYLPLKFSRRHGDPSRPWNKFSINTQNEIDGSKILDYQGNWRDIFQNWEALVYSYPEFIDGMIHRFLNATTFDGYNPYRITKGGFDWEVIEPDNPWSYIGYWGDHQIIYLLKFLEFIQSYYPKRLKEYFNTDLFVYANVPYKIKSYKDILKDPKNTIDFNYKAEEKIRIKKEEIGVDGALLRETHVFIYKVNFIEKILSTLLAKVSNFIPEAGIWMNTQRPEWNDANNALVGNGVSMVTLYYLRRFLIFFKGLMNDSSLTEVSISSELLIFFNEINDTLKAHEHLLITTLTDTNRKIILDGLGQPGSNYRDTIYNDSFSGKKEVIKLKEIKYFSEILLKYLDHSIKHNKREDGLFHSYNLMTLQGKDKVLISRLPEMLEGQVAVLSSGYLNHIDSLSVLDSLRSSKLFRPDQYSYILYPNKNLPRFVEKNNLTREQVESSNLLKELIKEKNKMIISEDILGGYHFNGNFQNIDCLTNALSNLPIEYNFITKKEKRIICEIFESNFNHKSFTGRSGTFFGYEGLGSIYWHMVSKLSLATIEAAQKAIRDHSDPNIIDRFFDHYFEINAGIGPHKSPELYGAFPTDPYSHTPMGKGAQQPGMTGQVKEDILSRFSELGIFVENGVLRFNPTMLKKSEFLNEPEDFEYYDVNSKKQRIVLTAGSLAFTICQVPIIYKINLTEAISIEFSNGKSKQLKGNKLDLNISDEIFKRTSKVKKIAVYVNK